MLVGLEGGVNAGFVELEVQLWRDSLSDEGEGKVDFIVDLLHGGQDHLPQAVLEGNCVSDTSIGEPSTYRHTLASGHLLMM